MPDNASQSLPYLKRAAEILTIGGNSAGCRASSLRYWVRGLHSSSWATIYQGMEVLNIQFNPALNLISTLTDMGILKEMTEQQRSRVFLFESYFKIFADRESEI